MKHVRGPVLFAAFATAAVTTVGFSAQAVQHKPTAVETRVIVCKKTTAGTGCAKARAKLEAAHDEARKMLQVWLDQYGGWTGLLKEVNAAGAELGLGRNQLQDVLSKIGGTAGRTGVKGQLVRVATMWGLLGGRGSGDLAKDIRAMLRDLNGMTAKASKTNLAAKFGAAAQGGGHPSSGFFYDYGALWLKTGIGDYAWDNANDPEKEMPDYFSGNVDKRELDPGENLMPVFVIVVNNGGKPIGGGATGDGGTTNGTGGKSSAPPTGGTGGTGGNSQSPDPKPGGGESTGGTDGDGTGPDEVGPIGDHATPSGGTALVHPVNCNQSPDGCTGISVDPATGKPLLSKYFSQKKGGVVDPLPEDAGALGSPGTVTIIWGGGYTDPGKGYEGRFHGKGVLVHDRNDGVTDPPPGL